MQECHVVICQRLLENVKDGDISTDVGIVCGDFMKLNLSATFLRSNMGLWVANI